jgi:hypothetical protein
MAKHLPSGDIVGLLLDIDQVEDRSTLYFPILTLIESLSCPESQFQKNPLLSKYILLELETFLMKIAFYTLPYPELESKYKTFLLKLFTPLYEKLSKMKDEEAPPIIIIILSWLVFYLKDEKAISDICSMNVEAAPTDLRLLLLCYQHSLTLCATYTQNKPALLKAGKFDQLFNMEVAMMYQGSVAFSQIEKVFKINSRFAQSSMLMSAVFNESFRRFVNNLTPITQ